MGFILNPKCGVVSVCNFTIVRQFNLQLLVMLFGQEVNVVISQPELSSQVTKAVLGGIPVPIEALTAIKSLLEYLE